MKKSKLKAMFNRVYERMCALRADLATLSARVAAIENRLPAKPNETVVGWSRGVITFSSPRPDLITKDGLKDACEREAQTRREEVAAQLTNLRQDILEDVLELIKTNPLDLGQVDETPGAAFLIRAAQVTKHITDNIGLLHGEASFNHLFPLVCAELKLAGEGHAKG